MPEPLEVLWSLAPVEIKLELSLNLIVEVLKMSEGRHAEITLDDGKYEIVLILLTKSAAKSGISRMLASYMIIWSKCRNI